MGFDAKLPLRNIASKKSARRSIGKTVKKLEVGPGSQQGVGHVVSCSLLAVSCASRTARRGVCVYARTCMFVCVCVCFGWSVCLLRQGIVLKGTPIEVCT